MININSKASRIQAWFFPTVILALSPFIAQCGLAFLRGQISSYHLMKSISPHGELIIVVVVLVAEALSDLWRRQIPRKQKDFIGSLCLGFVVISAMIFSGLSTGGMNAALVSTLSVHIFAIGIIGCLMCKLAGRS